jgi:transcriptional regulator with XRE-family HTH domain
MSRTEDIRQALIARKGQWHEIARKTGVSHSWLSKFVCRVTDNPSVKRMAALEAELLPKGGRSKQ